MSATTIQSKSLSNRDDFGGVPLGYKCTNVGVIPADWDCRRLSDLTTRVGSGITPTGGERVYATNGRPFLRSQNVGWGVLNLNDLAFITDEIHASFPASEIKESDVLLNITGASIGRSAVADIRVARGNVNQHVCEIRPDRERLDPHFLNSYLLSAAGQRQIDSFQAGGNRQGLNYSQIRSFLVPWPPLHEQRAIAEALSDVDGLLGALEALVAKKRAIKQAAMQQLLTGKTRLPGFSGEWETKRLGEVCSLKSGEGITSAKIDGHSANPCYGGNGLRGFTTTFTHQGDYALIGRQGALCGNVVGISGRFYASEHALVVTPKPATDMRWLTFVLARMNLNQYSESSAQPGLSAAKLLVLEIETPPTKMEQAAIASVFSDMDADIVALERRRDKTRAIKQGMMQQLLTGRVRLV